MSSKTRPCAPGEAGAGSSEDVAGRQMALMQTGNTGRGAEQGARLHVQGLGLRLAETEIGAWLGGWS